MPEIFLPLYSISCVPSNQPFAFDVSPRPTVYTIMPSCFNLSACNFVASAILFFHVLPLPVGSPSVNNITYCGTSFLLFFSSMSAAFSSASLGLVPPSAVS